MISPRTVCFVYFALFFGMPHANVTDVNTSTAAPSMNGPDTMSTTKETTGTKQTSNNKGNTLTQNTAVQISTTSACVNPTKPEKGLCIFCLPAGRDILSLIVCALSVGCLALLLTTLTCACQVCHLRGIISRLQSHYDNIDQHARREKSESPCWDEGQVDRHPTETCFLLSEVTTAQEESRGDQENKTEEENDTEQPSTVKDPNGDVAQENSPESDAKAPESSDTGV